MRSWTLGTVAGEGISLSIVQKTKTPACAQWPWDTDLQGLQGDLTVSGVDIRAAWRLDCALVPFPVRESAVKNLVLGKLALVQW